MMENLPINPYGFLSYDRQGYLQFTYQSPFGAILGDVTIVYSENQINSKVQEIDELRESVKALRDVLQDMINNAPEEMAHWAIDNAKFAIQQTAPKDE